MVHLAPSSTRRRLDIILGGFVAVLGVVVAVLAVIALGQPKGKQAAHEISTSIVHSTGPTTPEVATSVTAPSSSAAATSRAPSSTAATSASATPAAGVKAIPLIVLNSTTHSGLAAAAAKTFTNGGWTVTNSGNIVNNIASTCAYYDPSDAKNKPAAEALMAQYPTIKRVKEKFAELPAGPIVVVLTGDYG